jgi:hypothetical protein
MKKIGGIVKLAFSYSDCIGPRSHSAGVNLSVSTGDTYKFVNEVDWPSGDCRRVIEEGVRDGLVEAGFDPDLGVCVRLKSVEWDDYGSSEHSFYMAARCAARSLALIHESRLRKES